MRIFEASNNFKIVNKSLDKQVAKQSISLPQKTFTQNSLELLGIQKKALVSFCGYYGDQQPAKKLFWIATGRNHIYRDEETENNAWRINGQKKWSTTLPSDLLNKTPEQAIQSICTLNDTYYIPSYILSPNYGDNWGRRANYIEFNPRLLAKAEGNRKSEGLLNMIKLLPAIPPSSKSIPNCIILSQLYPTYNSYNDGYTGDQSLYTVDLHSGISKNLTSYGLERNGQRMGDDELVKAFNDLAHFRGLKTGFRMPISEGQLTIQGRGFNWYNDTEAFIDACCWAIDLGFDAIFLDSAKHIGGYDTNSYLGVGNIPDYQKMQYINYEIRNRTGRNDIAIIAEKADINPRFENLGFSAGNDWGLADDNNNLFHEYQKQEWNSNYAAGPIISDDNDNGAMSYEQRLHRIKNALHSYHDVHKKLPVYMQMHDIFPLNEYTNTHDTMLNSINRSAFGDVPSNYRNIFAQTDAAHNHTTNVYHEFAKQEW